MLILFQQSSTSRRSGTMTQAHRSHSATPGDYYPRSGRRGSLSPPDNRYSEYPVLPMQSQTSSKSATVTPTGSPKKRQLPQVPHATSRNSGRYLQETDDRGGGTGQRYSRHRARQQLQQQPTYRSTGMGGRTPFLMVLSFYSAFLSYLKKIFLWGHLREVIQATFNFSFLQKCPTCLQIKFY